jgi:hypothetical protein
MARYLQTVTAVAVVAALAAPSLSAPNCLLDMVLHKQMVAMPQLTLGVVAAVVAELRCTSLQESIAGMVNSPPMVVTLAAIHTRTSVVSGLCTLTQPLMVMHITL